MKFLEREKIKIEALFGRDHRISNEALKAYLALLSAVIFEQAEQISELKKSTERKGIEYQGVWDSNKAYTSGDFVTDRGSLWAATRSTKERPGVSSAWRLAVRKGRDGKDAR